MNISLTDELKAFVDEQVATGDYTTSSEYVRSLIRREKERHGVRNKLLEGASAGLAETGTDAYLARVQEGLDQVENAILPESIKLESIQDYIKAGIESGPGKPAANVLDRLEEKYSTLDNRED